MILYKLAKWMEEREGLRASIASASGDKRLLQRQKEQVEERMIAQAQIWLGDAEAGELPPAEVVAAAGAAAAQDPTSAVVS